MSNYKEQLNQLLINALTEIQELIDTHGVDSEHSNTKCLKVSESYQFNLDGDRYLTEITKKHLVDNSGYVYSYDVLPAEDLLCVLDDIVEKNKKVDEW